MTSPPLWSGLALLAGLAACGVSPPEPASLDRARFMEVLEGHELGPEPSLALCKEITDDELRGECSMIAVKRGVMGDADGALRWCPEAMGPVWQGECFFVAGESAAMRGDLEGARELCSRAGTFRSQCTFHLFQQRMTRESKEQDHLGEAEAHFETLLEDRDSNDPEAAVSRMWVTWFAQVMETGPLLATEAACEEVSEERRPQCLLGLAEALKRTRNGGPGQ